MAKLQRILRYARRQRLFLVLIPFITVLASLLTALQPWPLKLLVDHILGQAPLPDAVRRVMEWFTPNPTPLQLVVPVALAGLLIFILHSALEVALTWSWTLAGRRMVFALAEDLFANLTLRSLAFHRRSSVGDLLARVTGDSWVVHQVVDTLFFAPVHALLNTVAMIVLMLHLDVWMTLLAVVAAPATMLASLAAGRRLRDAAERKRAIEVQLQSHIQQTLSGISVVQAFAQEDREHARFQQFADASVRAQQTTTFVASINSLSSGLASTLGAGAVVWLGAHRVIAGQLTVGGVLVFLAYLYTLQAQVKVFAGIYGSLQGFNVGVRRVNEILDTPPEVTDRPDALPLPPVKGRVRFENVSFGYEPGRPVLRDLTFEAQPGQIIALVGLTGAGKSTLASLIPRFFDPESGRVTIDGHDLRSVRLKTLRDQVGLVPQDSLLLPVSIGENIAFGRPEATRAELESAARAANAHEFIAALPEGYDTMLGERGGTLSGGERQRLCIARALLRNAPILILDEPTSALDAQTESHLVEAVERLMKGRTTFIIAHRLSTVRRADCIVVLHEGRIVETGTHAELLARGGRYAQFHDQQFKTPAKAGVAV